MLILVIWLFGVVVEFQALLLNGNVSKFQSSYVVCLIVLSFSEQ